MLVVASAINERNCAAHTHSTFAVWICGRVKNALFAIPEVMQS